MRIRDLINITGGAASRVVITKPFKKYIWELLEKHIVQNIEVNVEGTLSVAKRRILTTKWVA